MSTSGDAFRRGAKGVDTPFVYNSVSSSTSPALTFAVTATANQMSRVGDRIATTDAVSRGPLDLQGARYVTKAANYTLVASDNDAVIRFTTNALTFLQAPASDRNASESSRRRISTVVFRSSQRATT